MTASISSLPQPAANENSAVQAPLEPGLRSRMYAGVIIVVVLIFGVGGWAAVAELSGAVIAPGQLVVDSNIKKVQHPSGGVVGKIFVRNGSQVESGDILLQLDDTQTRATLGIVNSQLTELIARHSRLAAQRDGRAQVEFPKDFESTMPGAAQVMAGERQLLSASQAMVASQKQQLNERIGQYSEEVAGWVAQRDAKAKELNLIQEELSRLQGMYEKQLVPVTRVLAMQRDEARIAGEHGTLLSQIAQSKGRITETKLQIVSIDRTIRNDSQKELRDIEAKLSELKERRIAAMDELKRIDIRAPQSGIVHELNVHTVGGVINPSEPVLLIVPSGDKLIIEVRINPPDIDQVSIGQTAKLRFSAFNQRTTPELPGKVVRLAADLSNDPQTGQGYYLARIAADETELSKLKQLKLLPGMPVEAFIQTGDRTMLSYIAKPLMDHVQRAFREE